jgi:hypothetical protein
VLEDFPMRLSLQVKKRKAEDKEDESLSKKSRYKSYTSAFGKILEQGEGLDFVTPQPRV